MSEMIHQSRCAKCHALIRWDSQDPEPKEFQRPKDSILFLNGAQVGMIHRSIMNAAATWDFECGACIAEIGLDGHD